MVSEVMLQQAQVSRVAPAYRAFLDRFPTVRSLAAASRRDVLVSWDGLGYNRRAVALSEAARTIVGDHGGRVPSDPVVLQRLPGVGPYSAAAVASIAFAAPVAAVDTNVRRIVARVFLGIEPDDAPAAEVRALAEGWLDRGDPGVWNQALMDLGREVCRPRPRCEVCPLRAGCRFRVEGWEPRPAKRRQPPFEGSARQVRGAVVSRLRRRADATLAGLAGETGFPLDRVAFAVAALASDGLVEAGPAALVGRPRGRVRLAG
ncbi:MAG TPA: A/G-specific adenine glycosylase [Actinomycetota bacterium]|nr:A/G-specific adenine glycosylase [Actinomycetota bacterium]